MTSVAPPPNSVTEKVLHVPRPGTIAAPAPLPAAHTAVACHLRAGLVIHGVDGRTYVLGRGVHAIPTPVWEAWLAVHADSAMVLNQQIFATE
jgi:hypothetical protein